MQNTKFIVQKDNDGTHIVLAKCGFHRELSGNIQNVISGGWFEFDQESKTFTLYGKSDQFGRASLSEIQQCIKNKKVFGDRQMRNNLTEEYSFKYRAIGGEVTDL